MVHEGLDGCAGSTSALRRSVRSSAGGGLLVIHPSVDDELGLHRDRTADDPPRR